MYLCVPLIACDFHMKLGKLSFFQMRRFQGLISEILRVLSLLGEKFIFSTPLGQPKFPGVSIFLLILMLPFLKNFPEQLELCFYFKYSRSYKAL